MPTVWRGNYHEPGWRIGIDTGVTTDFSLITYGTCNFDVDWGDGSTQTVDNVGPTTAFTTTHNYSTPGTYTVEFELNSGDFRPRYNNNPAAAELVTLGATPTGWSFGTNLSNAFYGSANLTTVGDIDTSAVTNFYQTWYNCSSLTSAPLIDTSSGTSFFQSWRGCSDLTSFPAKSGSLMDVSKGTTFYRAWRLCDKLEDFPANFFDSWTGTPGNNCFVGAWDDCPALTATSVENILNSIAASAGQQIAPDVGIDITIDYDAGTGTPDITAAVANLQGRGWTITLNGVAQ